MEKLLACPVCRRRFQTDGFLNERGDILEVHCSICGAYEITFEGWRDCLSATAGNAKLWTDTKRAALSHSLVRKTIVSGDARKVPSLDSELLERFLRNDANLPTPSEQANNIIRYLGDYEREHGMELIEAPKNFYAIVGSVSHNASAKLVIEMKNIGYIDAIEAPSYEGRDFVNASLTLSGWNIWEKLRRGDVSSNNGFIAMAFGDQNFDEFIENVAKPAVRSIEGLDLLRIDDRPRAGIIDNIMREMIQDAAFVLADLTHANNGAYWEAGYAEGLGKPVIYLCEFSAWEERKTHFDTNHCQTVIWDSSKPEEFAKSLVATIRNSLRKF